MFLSLRRLNVDSTFRSSLTSRVLVELSGMYNTCIIRTGAIFLRMSSAIKLPIHRSGAGNDDTHNCDDCLLEDAIVVSKAQN